MARAKQVCVCAVGLIELAEVNIAEVQVIEKIGIIGQRMLI